MPSVETLIVSSPEKINNIDEIRKSHLSYIKPDDENYIQSDKPTDFPVIINLGYNVHGNEPSSSEAAMLTAYTLISSKSKEVEEYLENLPLGGLEGEKFDGVKKDFKAGDVMVMISDGLPELPNPTNDLLDYEKVENCIKENAECSAEEIKNALVYLSDDWAKGVMNPDDITIVVIKKAA